LNGFNLDLTFGNGCYCCFYVFNLPYFDFFFRSNVVLCFGARVEMASGVRARGWCLTINNPLLAPNQAVTSSDWPSFAVSDFQNATVVYSCRQLEKGENAGTPHIQAVVYYQNARSFDAVKKAFPTAHIEVMRASLKDAAAYCQKPVTRVDGTDYVEHGVMPPGQGIRNDIVAVSDAIVNGELKTISSIAKANPALFVRNSRGFSTLLSLQFVPRTEPMKVLYIWGPTGSGKTLEMYRTVSGCPTLGYNELGARMKWDDVYIASKVQSSSGTMWFDGYAQQKYLVFEEFNDSFLPLTTMNMIIGNAPVQLQTKGGMIHLNSQHLIILSNHSPESLYMGVAEAARLAFQRRLLDPNTGTSRFLGYGPKQDLPFCPCLTPKSCPLVHDPSGPSAIAPGVVLPPPDGLTKKPRVGY